MGLHYLLIGCFFLLNPYLSIIDLIPDFIGYIFILKGLSKAAKVSESFADAYRKFGLLLLLSIGRIFTIPTIADTEEVWPLISVLCFGIAEAYLTVSAFHEVFEGLNYTAHSPDDALYVKWREVRQFTVFFAIAKQVLCILPELTLLSNGDYGIVTPEGVTSPANYRLLYNGIGMVVALFIGIAWFVQIRGYLKRVVKDQPYQLHLLTLYRDRYTNVSSVYLASNLRTVLTLFMVGAVLSIELIFDGVNYLPHLLSSIFFAIGAKKLMNLPGADNRYAKRTFLFSLLYGLLSLPRFVYSIIFSNRIFGEYLDSELEGVEYSYSFILQESLMENFDTIYGFAAQIALAAMEAVLMGLTVWFFFRTVNSLIGKHTRASLPKPPVSDELQDLPRPKDEAVVAMYRWNIVMLMAGILTALSMIVATVGLAYLPVYWLVDALIRLCFVVITYFFLSKVRDEIDSHYSLLIREDHHDLTR